MRPTATVQRCPWWLSQLRISSNGGLSSSVRCHVAEYHGTRALSRHSLNAFDWYLLLRGVCDKPAAQRVPRKVSVHAGDPYASSDGARYVARVEPHSRKVPRRLNVRNTGPPGPTIESHCSSAATALSSLFGDAVGDLGTTNSRPFFRGSFCALAIQT